ncbi:MAG: hypothetical protein K8F52_01810 [Candidatus Scalindua rubra]|uniref:Uncharacterized protein n=1 Tax=Candidatus Scalindua brodae TaxID=237368 RepID=A0A0B0EGB8_9BACT|nr:MAG: hypothetical protein SCABRO_02183 [Candidatus Scalindua brodae]MBZ0107378.1 hypothetical protein [Candidatus Scalindua rubra]TWU31425.1 hypothetical protein S225a_20970 [Candidatus Brocadiaceae bacterium S225]
MITKKEIQKERSPLGLRQFVLRRKNKISKITDERHKAMLKNGLYKQFSDEIIPLSLFCLKNYQKNFKIIPDLGEEGYDAIVKDENGDLYENIELTFPHDGKFEADDSRETINKGIGNFRIYEPGEDLNNLRPFIMDTCRKKLEKDYSDCSLVIILGLFIRPYNQHKKLYINILEEITEEIKQKFKFKAKSVYILFTPFKKIIKIG